MAHIQGTLSSAPGITNKLVIVIYKTTAPSTELARIVKNPPHTSPYNFEFTDLAAGNYIVNIHESTDGIALGNLRHDYWVDAESNDSIIKVIDFICNRGATYDPNQGDTQFNHPDTVGLEAKLLFIPGIGAIPNGIRWHQTATGVELIDGSAFTDGQECTLVLAGTTTVTAAPPAEVPFSIVVEKTSDATLTLADLNKVVVLNHPSKLDMTLPMVGTATDGVGYLFQSETPSGKIIAGGADKIRFRGADIGYLYLGWGESVRLVKAAGKWYALEAKGQWEQVGRRIGVDNSSSDLQRLNMVLADGSELDGNLYRRLYDFVASLPPAQVMSLTAWTTNTAKQRFFGLDTVTKKIRVPKMQGLFIRFLNNISAVDPERGDNIPGGYQGQAVYLRGEVKRGDSYSGSGQQAALRTGGGQGTNTQTPVPVDWIEGMGNETRPANVGQLPVVLI